MLTEEQIELRKKGIGSSDIARIICFDKWDVWADKTGKDIDRLYTPAMRRGDALEPVIAQLYAERMECYDVLKAGTSIGIDSWMLATPDYWVQNTDDPVPMILECKAPGYRMGWGNEWTDDVPRHVIIQTQWQMGVVQTSRRYCHVAALIGNEFLIYHVEYDDVLFCLLTDIASNFWFNHVLKDIPPKIDDSDAATKWLDRRYSKSSSSTMLNKTNATSDLVKKLRECNNQIKKLKSKKTEYENQLKEIIGMSEGIEDLCTWKSNKNGQRRFQLL